MAIALSAEFNGTTAGATSFTVTGVNAASGTVAAVVVHMKTGSSNSVSSITDTGSNTYTFGVSAFQSGANSRVEIWTAPINTALSSGTVTVNLSGSIASRASVSVWTGAASPVVVDASNGVGSAATTTPAAVTVTTTDAGDVVIGGISYPNASAPSAGPGNSFTRLSGGSPASSFYGDAAYRIPGSTGSFGPSWTLPASVASGGATIALKPTAGSSIAPPAATATAQALAPTIDTTLAVPAAATVTAQALVPTLTTVTGISPPAATVTAQAQAPSLTFQAGTVWPPDGRFLFYLCDSDGDFVGEILAAKVRRLTYLLNGVHTADVTLSLDDPLAASIEPGLSRLKVYRLKDDGTRVLCFYGTTPADTHREDAAASEMSMTFMDPRWVLKYRFLHPSANPLDLQPGIEFVDTFGFGDLVASLIGQTNLVSQSWINPSVGPGGTTSVTVSLDQRTLYDMLDDFTTTGAGFDWDITPVDYFTSIGTRTQGDLKVYDTQGSNLTSMQFIYGEDLPSNVANITRTYTAPITLVNLTGTDQTTSATLSSTAGTPDDATYGALELFESATDVRGQAQLDDRAAAIATANAAPRQVISVAEPLANAPTALDDYYIGDTVYVTCRKGSMIFNNQAQRVHGFTIDIDSTGYEKVSLTLAD